MESASLPCSEKDCQSQRVGGATLPDGRPVHHMSCERTSHLLVLHASISVGVPEQWWAMVFYAAFFACATYAFALMGMKEFFGTAPSSPEPADGRGTLTRKPATESE